MKPIILLWMCMAILTGCKANHLELYKNAVEKTDTIDYAKAQTEIQIKVDYGKNSPAALKESLKVINYVSEAAFSKSENKRISRQYLGNEHIGIDTVYYHKGDQSFMKIPFLGKFMILDQNGLGGINQIRTLINEASALKIREKWLALLNEVNIENLGSQVVDLPQGAVKVKTLLVTFTDGQVKAFLREVLKIIGEDDTFQTKIKDGLIYNVDKNQAMLIGEVVDLSALINSLSDYIRFVTFDAFTVRAYIDADDYMVDKAFDVRMSFESIVSNYLKALTFSSSYQVYDMGEGIDFVYPELDDNNTRTLEFFLKKLDINTYGGGF